MKVDSSMSLARSSYDDDLNDDLDDEQSIDPIDDEQWEEDDEQWEDSYSQYDSDDYEDPDYEYDE